MSLRPSICSSDSHVKSLKKLLPILGPPLQPGSQLACHAHNRLLRLANDLVNGLGKVLDIPRVETSHADAAVLGHVDVGVLAQLQDLGLAETGEAEHADLVGDVVPGARGAELLELGTQDLAHLDDAAGHGAQVVLPLGEQGGVVEDGAGDAGAVQRGVGDLGALQDGELGGDAGGGVGGVGGRGGDEVEAAGALAVEAKVLGEGLGDEELEALLDEVADGPGVAGEVAGGEALVGAVEEGEVVLLAQEGGDLLPLLLGRVDARGVVGAGVEEDDGAVGGGGDGGLHALKVEALCLLGEVGVLGDGEADIAEDLVVVRPRRVGDVDGAVALVELGEEEGAEMDGTGAGDGLDGGGALLADGGRVGAEHQLVGLRGEADDTGDGGIFVVEFRVVAEDLVGLCSCIMAGSAGVGSR